MERNVSASDRKYVLLMQYINLPRNVTLDVARTEWRGDSLCKYCISMWMLSFIGGAILATFILLNPKGGTSYHHTLYSQPWKQVIPMFMVTIVILPFVSYSTFTTFGGILQFCAAFENYTGSKSCNKRIDVFSLKYNDEIHSVYALQHIVKASSGLVFTSWIFCTLILLIRICTAPDFELQVIVLTKKGKTCEFQPRMLSRPSGTYLSGLRSRTSIPSQSSIDKELPTLTTESGSY
ncbi:hypothetical protein QE152_g26682 [Popillia japonica]|uniref:Uncharacterized protein n=1 Tax=Popillia japonica TaxID=7064 RepID=A0AAW1JXK5_POPJA